MSKYLYELVNGTLCVKNCNEQLEIFDLKQEMPEFTGYYRALLALSNVNPYEKSLGANFLSRYFEICFRYKRRLYHSFIKEDIPRLLEYELKEDALRKVEEDTTEILDLLHKMYDYITVNSEATQQHNIVNLEQKAKTTIEKFSELYEKVLIFETPGQDIKLKDVFVWPEYRTGILRNDQDDLSIVIQKFLCNSLGQYLYDKVLFGKKRRGSIICFLF